MAGTLNDSVYWHPPTDLAFDAAPFEYYRISNDIAKFKQMGSSGEQVGLEWLVVLQCLACKYFHYR